MQVHAVKIEGQVSEINERPEFPVVVIKASSHPLPSRLGFIVIEPANPIGNDQRITVDGEKLSTSEFIAKIRKTPIRQFSAEVSGTVSLVGAKQELYHGQPDHERPMTTVSRVMVNSLVITKYAEMPANVG